MYKSFSPGRELSYKKALGRFWELLRRYQDLVLRVWLEMFFTPKEFPNSKATHLSPILFLSTQNPKRYNKSSRCGALVAGHSKGYLGKVSQAPRGFFYLGVPPGGIYPGISSSAFISTVLSLV